MKGRGPKALASSLAFRRNADGKNFARMWDPVVARRLGLALGIAIILACARGDLWLDEIWSFEWSRRAASAWEILKVFRHDNNHPLNTWWLMLVGEHQSLIVFRFPAVVSGIISLFLVSRLAFLLDPASEWIAVLLSALSFPLALYFSEARGYAPAVACALGTVLLLLRTAYAPSWTTAAGFWLVCGVGMLSHATFLFVLMALGIWEVIQIFHSSTKWVPAAWACALWFVIPGFMACAYYLCFLRGMQIGGGPQYAIPSVLGHFFGHALALPAGPPLAVIVFGGAIYLLAVAALKEGRHKLLFILLPLPVGLTLAVARPEILYFRYFLVLLPFFYLALAAGLARMLTSSFTILRYGAVVLILAYSLAQAPKLLALGVHGRGEYRSAMAFMALSPFANKVVSSDHDFRNGLLVEFYRQREVSPVTYVPLTKVRTGQLGWFIRHTQEPLPSIPEKYINTQAGRFRLVRVYPYAGVSGWHWILYYADPLPKRPWSL